MTPTETPAAPRPPRRLSRHLPWLCAVVVAVYCASVFGRMRPPRAPYNLDAFAQLPVLEGGRVKPLDSSARMYLRFISGQSVFIDSAGNEQPAIKWYLDTLGSDPADKANATWDYRVFRIDNEQVLSQLKFQPREGLRFSLNELRPHVLMIEKKGQEVQQKRKEKRKTDLEDDKWFELWGRLGLVRHVAEGFGDDRGDAKLHLLPPQSAGEGWASLGEIRSVSPEAAVMKAHEGAFEEAVVTARTRVKARVGGFGPEDEKALIARFKLPEDRRQAVINLLFTDDPRSIHGELQDVILETLLSELPPADREAIRAQQETSFRTGRAAAEQAERAAVAARLAANPAAAAWDKMIAAREQKRPEEFNRLLAEYQENCLRLLTGEEVARVRLETTYNRFAPFMQCTALYIIVFVLSALGFILAATEKKEWGGALRRSASWVLYATLIVHTAALLVRMSLMDRPLVFVTNLYSSAVFIGWGCVAIGLVLERLYPLGIGNTVAAVLGIATTIVAHNLTTDDTLEMMQAVLDTNFWLATHVTTVTLGYTATFVAGFLGAVYVLLMLAAVVKEGFVNPRPASVGSLLSFGAAAAGIVGIPLVLLWFLCTSLLAKYEVLHSSLPTVLMVVTAGAALFYAGGLLFLKAGGEPTDADGKPLPAGQLPAAARPLAGMALTAETNKVIGQMVYGVLCFATLLSFVGTVLGGIWADQSWGRFWGWDPKENGAVLIVLWNALILHARWCGMVKERGMAVMALFGNVICAWSWYGTNQLGIGLHAYGFDTRLADGCTNFWLSQFLIIGLGLIPRAYWADALKRGAPAAKPQPAAALASVTPPSPAPQPAVNGAAKNGHASPSVVKGKKSKKK